MEYKLPVQPSLPLLAVIRESGVQCCCIEASVTHAFLASVTGLLHCGLAQARHGFDFPSPRLAS